MSSTDTSDSVVDSPSAVEPASRVDTDLPAVAVTNEEPIARADTDEVASISEATGSAKDQGIPRVLLIEEVEEVNEANVPTADISSSASPTARGASTEGSAKADAPPPLPINTAAIEPPPATNDKVNISSSSEAGNDPTSPVSSATTGSITFKETRSSGGGGGAPQSELDNSSGTSSGHTGARRMSAPAGSMPKSILKKQSSLPPGASFAGSSPSSKPPPLQRMASAPLLDSAASHSVATDRTTPAAPKDASAPRRQSRRISFSTELDMGVALDKGERYRCRYSCGFVGYMEEVAVHERTCPSSRAALARTLRWARLMGKTSAAFAAAGAKATLNAPAAAMRRSSSGANSKATDARCAAAEASAAIEETEAAKPTSEPPALESAYSSAPGSVSAASIPTASRAPPSEEST